MVFNQIIQKKSGNQIKLKRNNNKKKSYDLTQKNCNFNDIQ
jgi:hypothetical protein